ncbi:LOW QUALITY PROTEIN: hypothetical protein Bca4012_060814 [Brassica carinata]
MEAMALGCAPHRKEPPTILGRLTDTQSLHDHRQPRFREPKALTIVIDCVRWQRDNQTKEQHKQRPMKPVDKVPEGRLEHEPEREKLEGREAALTLQNSHRRLTPTLHHWTYHEPPHKQRYTRRLWLSCKARTAPKSLKSDSSDSSTRTYRAVAPCLRDSHQIDSSLQRRRFWQRLRHRNHKQSNRENEATEKQKGKTEERETKEEPPAVGANARRTRIRTSEHRSRSKMKGQIQDDVLKEILTLNANTEYLRGYLHGSSDKELFKKNVPVVSYDDVKPYIQRVANGEPSNVISGKPITRFLLSSGTSGGKQKIFPVNNKFFEDMAFLYALRSSVISE